MRRPHMYQRLASSFLLFRTYPCVHPPVFSMPPLPLFASALTVPQQMSNLSLSMLDQVLAIHQSRGGTGCDGHCFQPVVGVSPEIHRNHPLKMDPLTTRVHGVRSTGRLASLSQHT